MTHPMQGKQGDQGQRGERGVVGLTGLDGAVGLIGERGPTGDHGQHGDAGDRGLTGDRGFTGSTGFQGRRGNVGDAGPAGIPGTPGLDAPPSRNSRLANTLKYFSLACGVVVVMLSLIVTAAGQRNLNQVQDRLEEVQDASAQTQEDAAQLIADRKQEQDIEDCFNLYRNDVIVTNAAFLTQFVDYFATVRAGDEDQIDRAAGRLNVVTFDYKRAISHYIDYTAIIPAPVECPHP